MCINQRAEGITSDLAGVVCQPSRMASSSIRGQRTEGCRCYAAQSYSVFRVAEHKNLPFVLRPLCSERGISLIELIMFIVIVSVGLAGLMMAMDPATKNSADPVIRKQALTIAESLLEEIEQKVFTHDDTVGRENYNDIFDYNGLTGAVYHANSSVLVIGLESYSVNVAVVSGVAATLPVTPAASAALITVTVNGPGGQSIEMTGYKVAH